MTKLNIDDIELSQKIENLLVQKNVRGMKDVQEVLKPGYYLRAATLLNSCKGTVLIGTGFPVDNTFETDGPVGAIALYQALKILGANPILVCGAPLATVLADDFNVYEITVGDLTSAEAETQVALAELNPELVISIERPGLSDSGGYFNMRGEDISPRCACFDYFLRLAKCPTIAIGDGGNEIGMGNLKDAVNKLDIIPAATTCDELLIADVSNWGAHGLIALLAKWNGSDLLAAIHTGDILRYISERGGVDGVTRENTLTEDGLPVSEGQKVILTLRQLTGFT
ncbi:MAG: hypothetical protein ACI90U_001778 [Pseudomonadales bacterium]|jgi:hypothetical protein